MFGYGWLVLIAPLAGFISLSCFGGRIPRSIAGYLACAAVGFAFLISLVLLVHLYAVGAEHQAGGVQALYTWIDSGQFHLDFAILIDPLSVFMFLIVTGVGFLIHVYSLGYMENDPEFKRFFAYLNLFIFSMCVLVSAADFFFLIVGWALVGLASYLLIGFWRDKTSAVLAARKAFVMNVIGDVGMLVAAFMIYETFGTLSYREVFEAAPTVYLSNDINVILITLFLLVGAFAKSAQLPLHTWLPDAMEGPTPVSALIHAATMVTAGVYLVARCHTLYELAPFTMYVIAIVGLLTATFAGTIAIVQTDIKRVIAYSTMSQLGYMFLAVGLGMFGFGMFHLMTHAFFKALLFLGAGSVIHSMHEEQDIQKMGGLSKAMPITYITFLIGSLALAGFPLTSGFFSKEAIIMASYHSEMGNFAFWGLAIFTAGMTAFYTFRLFFCVFQGDLRTPDAHPHESPITMTAPLLILAFFALTAGALGSWVDNFLSPVFGGHAEHFHDGFLETIAILVGLGGILTAALLYMARSKKFDLVKEALAPLQEILFNKYYVDEIYDFLIVKPVKAISVFLEDMGEKKGVDFAVDQVGEQVREVSRYVSLWQSGRVRDYAVNMVAGMALALIFVAFL